METIHMNNVLLMGDPGIGKTTLIKNILTQLPSKIKVSGFYTQEIKSGKTRKGFHLITLDGQQAVLAHASKKSTYKVGKYAVNMKVMQDIGVATLKNALENSDIILIDEIGKMECFCLEFREIAARCLDSPKPVLGAIQNFASPFVNSIKNRDDIARITLTIENRDQLSTNIAELLQRMLPQKPKKKHRKNR